MFKVKSVKALNEITNKRPEVLRDSVRSSMLSDSS